MRRLTARTLKSATDDELFELLGAELSARLPARDDSSFARALDDLPVGLRAMAATYELDVSIALDDLGWHFGNWHSEDLARETLVGLKELEAWEFAELFSKAYDRAKSYWTELGAPNWSDWYSQSGLCRELEPLNQRAWQLWGDLPEGLFTYWVEYARKHPRRVGAEE